MKPRATGDKGGEVTQLVVSLVQQGQKGETMQLWAEEENLFKQH